MRKKKLPSWQVQPDEAMYNIRRWNDPHGQDEFRRGFDERIKELKIISRMIFSMT
jgi:hypothetical protein